MLRRRPRRSTAKWWRHPATGWLILAGLYLTATVVNVLLAIQMGARWPMLVAGLLAAVTTACVLAAVSAGRRN